MKSWVFSSLILFLAGDVLSAPTSELTVRKIKGPVVPDSYIVTLKPGASRSAHVASLTSTMSLASDDSKVVIKQEYTDVFKGYSATLKGSALAAVLKSKDVLSVEPDVVLTVADSEDGESSYPLVDRDIESTTLIQRGVTYANKTWFEADPLGLPTIDDGKRALIGPILGAGVDVFGIDTGIYTAHSDFGGRAVWGAIYTSDGTGFVDLHGHGTHTAATAVGLKYGIASRARVIAVKVLSDSGNGYSSWTIKGIDYAVRVMRATRRPSVAIMSLGGPASTAVDAAINSALAAGLHICVAAGNENVNANTRSPARVPGAITVGSIDINNIKAPSSNWGSVVDIQARGVAVLSAGITSPISTSIKSGTSMATPYVVGIIASMISKYGNRTPASMSVYLKAYALPAAKKEPLGTTTLKARAW